MKKIFLTLTALSVNAHAEIRPGEPVPEPDPQMAQYYQRESIPLPEGETMEISSIAILPNQKVAVGTRRGDVWICSGAHDDDLTKVSWKKFHSGLHEPLGMFYQDGWIHFSDRKQYGRMRDTDNNGEVDEIETISNEWGISGDYHEYNFGSTPDKDGNIYSALCLTGSYFAKAQWRGWVMKISPDGEMTPYASGVRSPGGIGFNAEGDVFYTDNQGKWNGTSCLKHAKPGSFTGCPVGNVYYKDAPNMGPQPLDPIEKSRIETQRSRIPQLVPPAVQIPHGLVGQSPTAIITDLTNGKFGPFQNQILIGEQTHSEVQRIYLEKVKGVYQGAVFKFLSGFDAGIVPMRLAPDGTLFTGGTNRGWSSLGDKPFSFERVRFTGKTPPEMKTMSANKDGFTLTFTKPVDTAELANMNNYALKTWTYIYQSQYGSPQVDQTKPSITSVTPSADGTSVRLTVKGLQKGHVHQLKTKLPIWHQDAYYTLNEIPD